MRKIEQVFSYLLENASEAELDYIESYVFVEKTTLQWITEAENNHAFVNEAAGNGEPASHTIMQMAHTAVLLAREAYKNL